MKKLNKKKLMNVHKMLKTLENPTVKRIVRLLMELNIGMSVTDIYKRLRLTQPEVSMQLNNLLFYNIVIMQVEGKQHIYEINRKKIKSINLAFGKAKLVGVI